MKAWSKTMGDLALSSGESELAAVVRAATAGLGQLWLVCHVAIKSDATDCCDRDGSSTRIGNSSTFGCGSFMDLASRSFGERSRLQNVTIEESE